MKIPRRNILKGMLAGGALAAYGIPQFSFAGGSNAAPVEPRDIVLLATGNAALFRQGVVRTGAVVDEHFISDGLPDVRALRALLSSLRGKRLVGLLPDSAYALLAELARDAGVTQMIEGRHSIGADGRTARHALHSVAGFHGAAESLAADLVHEDAGFAITEVPLNGSARALSGGDWSPHGFSSYRIAPRSPSAEIWMHLDGLDVAQGCEAFGVDATQAEPLRCLRTYVPQAADTGSGWEQTLGRTLAQLATRGADHSVPCVSQAFVRRSLLLDEGAGHDSHVSFVMHV
jgi:hypothetical protein